MSARPFGDAQDAWPPSPSPLPAPEVEARLLADQRDLFALADAVHLAVEGPGGMHEVLDRLREGAVTRKVRAYWDARLERVLRQAYDLRESTEADLLALLDALDAERVALVAEVAALRDAAA